MLRFKKFNSNAQSNARFALLVTASYSD